MKISFTRSLLVLAALSLANTSGGFPALPPAERSGKELAALEQKLHGIWQGPACGGIIVMQSNGTFEWTGMGPGNEMQRGYWETVWTGLPPSLVLHIKDASVQKEIGQSFELKLIRLDDTEMHIQYVG